MWELFLDSWKFCGYYVGQRRRENREMEPDEKCGDLQKCKDFACIDAEMILTVRI